MNIKALIKVLATWVIIIVLVIAYLIDERSIVFVVGFAAFTLFSMFLYALYSGNLEENGRAITKEMPSYPKPKPGSCVRNHDTNFKE